MKLSTNRAFFFNVNHGYSGWIRLTVFYIIFVLSQCVYGQILFSEECFTGGVLTGGADTFGMVQGVQCEIDWQPHYTIRRAYAVTYRYGRPDPFALRVNGIDVLWNTGNQAGPEQIENNDLSNYFAPHLIEITDQLSITTNQLILDFPLQEVTSTTGNWGWWGMYIIVLYDSPNITSEICLRHYIANQSQLVAQNYTFALPDFNQINPVIFGIHAGRLSEFYSDASRITINNQVVGDMWEGDSVTPYTLSGAQGHFSYRNGEVIAFNGDTVNATVKRHDGTAIINGYLNTLSQNQSLKLNRIEFSPTGGANPHPSFVIAYTPACEVIDVNMTRSYTFCRGEQAVLQAAVGYEHYEWSPATQLSDATIANPICTADSSRWYRVRMWSDGPDAPCAQTIPVFVEVGQTPRPGLFVSNVSSCPKPTGRIRMEEMLGSPPFQYTVGTQTNNVGLFEMLAAGTYAVSITDALGCIWDTVAVVKLNTPHTAAFTANPQVGDSPLLVNLTNQSTNPTPGSMTYEWLANSELFSTSLHTQYTFADTGTYTVSLIAYLNDPACADTASITIRVNPGIRIILPNIFTPNGDGVNDKLVAELFGLSTLRWEVYNRWGNMLHSGADNSGEGYIEIWNGTDVPAGVYPVLLSATGINGKTERMQVMVTLLY